jgi:hypothetical protein
MIPQSDHADLEAPSIASLRAKFAALQESKRSQFQASYSDADDRPQNKSGTTSTVVSENRGFTAKKNKRNFESLPAKGFGKRWKAKLKKERTARLHCPKNRAKAAQTKISRTRASKGDLRNDNICAALRDGGSYNYGRDRWHISPPSRANPKKQAYLLNAKERQARSEGRRDWNELRLLFLASISQPATTGLSAPAPRRNKSEEVFETFVSEQLLPLTLSYPEFDTPQDCNDLFLGWDGRFSSGVRDFDLDLPEGKMQVQVKGIGWLYYRAKDLIKEHWDERRLPKYRRLRTDVFNLLLRYHQNVVFCEHADISIRPLALVSATSVRSWRRTLKDTGVLISLLDRENEKVLNYLKEFAKAVFPKEYTIYHETTKAVETRLESRLKRINHVDLLEMYRDVLAGAKDYYNYRDTFRSDGYRFATTYWSDVYPNLPARFAAPRR